MYWLLNKYVIGAIVVALILSFTHLSAYRAGKASVQAAWDKDRAVAAEAAAAAEQKVRQIERTMNEAAAKYVKDKYDAIRALNDRHRAIVDGLRQRASRPLPGAVSSPAGTAAGSGFCTGAELHREDGEFLAGEAARADELRAELSACYQQYEAARAAVNRN